LAAFSSCSAPFWYRRLCALPPPKLLDDPMLDRLLFLVNSLG
jgi:hypothetical protein